MRVVTYNIHHGEGADGAVDLERIARVLRSAQPEVVCLQEVDRGLARSHHADIAEVLAKALDMRAVFAANMHFGGGQYGLATLTSLPVLETEHTPLPVSGGAEPRGVLRARVTGLGRAVDVYNTHWGLDPAQRALQARTLSGLLNGGPAVVAGDLNEEPSGGGAGLLLRQLKDSAAGHAPLYPRTFPAWNAKVRIDYILTTPCLRAVSAGLVVHEEARVASDHRAYAAALGLSEDR